MPDDGFRCAGCRYASLSAVVREITGECWSGPAFFGLTYPIMRRPRADLEEKQEPRVATSDRQIDTWSNRCDENRSALTAAAIKKRILTMAFAQRPAPIADDRDGQHLFRPDG